MPLYEFMCENCGRETEEYFPIQQGPKNHPCKCGGTLLRIWTPPSLPKPFQGHFNHSLGRWVNSMADFKSGLSQGADEASARDGLDHRFTVVEPDAHKETGVTDGGLKEAEATARRVRQLRST